MWGVFVYVVVVYGFELCNHKIAGSTMSKREQAVRSSSANECPAGHLSEGISHSHQKIRRTTKVRFSFRFLTVWAVRKQRIQKTLNSTNLRTNL